MQFELGLPAGGATQQKKVNIMTKKYTNSEELKRDLRKGKIKEDKDIILDETLKRDVFLLSMGNRKVLETIPKMMEVPKFRKELRRMTLDFLQFYEKKE